MLALVRKEPGLRERHIAARTGFTVAVVRGHLLSLGQRARVVAVEDAVSRRYYPLITEVRDPSSGEGLPSGARVDGRGRAI